MIIYDFVWSYLLIKIFTYSITLRNSFPSFYFFFNLFSENPYQCTMCLFISIPNHSLHLFPASSSNLPLKSLTSLLLAINICPLKSRPHSLHKLCLYMSTLWTPYATYFNKYFTPEVNCKHVKFLLTGLWNVSGNTLYASWQLISDLKIVYFPSNVGLLSLCIALI